MYRSQILGDLERVRCPFPGRIRSFLVGSLVLARPLVSVNVAILIPESGIS